MAQVLNPDIPKDALGDKGIVLDVHVELKDGRHVDVEMQSARQVSFSTRALYYLARLYSSNLHKGDEYDVLKSCVSILILGYRQWATDRFHCTFHVAEDRSHERFSDAIEIHTIELPKVPSLGARPPGAAPEPALNDWGLFLAARSEEELEAIAMHNPDIAKAKSALDTLSADPHARELAEMRFKAEVAYRLEIAAREALGRAEGRAESKREDILKIFATRGLTVSDAQRAKVLECVDLKTLDRWFDQAVQATSVEAALE
ncbi:MAG: Rpn family recombination-promoting nuclease/putative transposase [Myxococcales bacterium]